MDYVNKQVNQLVQLANQLSKKLEVQIEIPKCNTRHEELQKLQRIIKTFQEELEQRTQQAMKIYQEIQVKSDAVDENYITQIQQILGTTAQNIPECLQQGVTPQQLLKLQQLNQQIDLDILPKFDETNRIRQRMIELLDQLGRSGLETYFSQRMLAKSPEMDRTERINQEFNGVLSEKELQIINLAINNNLQPKYNQFLTQFCSQLEQELCERQKEKESVSQQIKN